MHRKRRRRLLQKEKHWLYSFLQQAAQQQFDFTDSDDNFQVSEEEINIGISVKKGNTELLDGINSVLSTMTADDFDSMMNEAISVQPLSE